MGHFSKKTAKLLICGDLFPSPDIQSYFSGEKMEKLIDSRLYNLFTSGIYDFITANLECQLTNCCDKILKCGPNLKANQNTVNGISQIKIDLVTLGNNHSLDYGSVGLQDTLDALSEKNIEYIGICNSSDYSKNFIIKNINEKKIGFYSLCENEFSSYLGKQDGANVIENPRVFKEISTVKK